MAVPKKRTGHSAQGKRRSNWKATKPVLTTCPSCGAKVLAHTVCTACGQYKGKPVSKKGLVEEAVQEEVKETKKTRKTTKKAAEVKVEEVKTEEKVEEEKSEEVKDQASEENNEQ